MAKENIIEKVVKRIRKPKVKIDGKVIDSLSPISKPLHGESSLNIFTGGRENHSGIIINTQ